jgi:predicted nucleic acid-binding protein
VKSVFVDTVYWITVVVPGDQWKARAEKARADLGSVRLIITDEVLTEFLAALSSGGERIRRQGVRMVQAIMSNVNIRVLPQSRDSFLGGLRLYEERPDKGYSVTDCISMNAMRADGIAEILTNDHHFAQEGFTVLISR